jgi:hypothetical protein
MRAVSFSRCLVDPGRFCRALENERSIKCYFRFGWVSKCLTVMTAPEGRSVYGCGVRPMVRQRLAKSDTTTLLYICMLFRDRVIALVISQGFSWLRRGRSGGQSGICGCGTQLTNMKAVMSGWYTGIFDLCGTGFRADQVRCYACISVVNHLS